MKPVASLAIAISLAVTACGRDQPAARHDAAPTPAPGTRVRDPAPPNIAPAALISWLHAAAPAAPMFSVDGRVETAATLQHTERVFRRTFEAQGFAAPPPERVGEYLATVLLDRMTTATVRARAEAAGITAGDAQVAALREEIRAHLAAQTPDLVPPDAELRDRAIETVLVDRLITPDLQPVEAELDAWLRSHRAELTFAPAARIIEVRLLAGAVRDDARVRAAALRSELAPLADDAFAARAARDSQVPALARPRWVGLAGLPPDVRAAIEAAAPGATTDVLEGPPGFAIVRVVAKQARAEPPLAELRDEVLAGWRDEHRADVLRAHYAAALAAHDVRLFVR